MSYTCRGSYFVVWPQGSLRPCLEGQAVVFDTYSQGCAFLAKEVSLLTGLWWSHLHLQHWCGSTGGAAQMT